MKGRAAVTPGAPRAVLGVLIPPLLALLVLFSGCGQGLPESFSLLADVKESRIHVGDPGEEGAAGLSFRRQPETRVLTVDHERRPVVLTTVDTWTWRGRIPGDGAALHGGVQILPEGWGLVRRFQARIVLRDGDRSEILDSVRMDAGPDQSSPRWLDFGADLSRHAGREVTLEFAATIDGLPPEHRGSNVVAWGPVRLSGAGSEAGEPRERPNILFVLVDTLRFDHTTPYGYRRDTTPNLERLLARPGVVVEEAYSQAPWTLPSVTSFVTGRYPGEVLGDDATTYGVPAGVKTLAERLEGLGYQTGGFYANGTLHAGNGFDRGFQTFYAPPPRVQPDAAELNRRALPWLGAHARGHRDPFFLYVHYIDPHDPYSNPDIVSNRSPFYPEYEGKVEGGWIHGIYNGNIQLEDPERDVAQVKALYDSEVRYMDRFLGELIAAIPPDELEETLIVLTADHGEELNDHGGWKHGFTLYEDQIHVPLIFRWDGRIPAGRRLPGTVRLLDLAPTLVAAAGGEPDPAWQGVDLMPALTGKAALPRLHAFSQHMMIGPLRASVVLDRRKLILFNPQTPFAPNDPLQSYLWTQDLARLQRVELYDLSRDPREKQNRAATPAANAANAANAASAEVGRMEPLIHRQLDRQRPGLRVMASGLPAGSRLRGTVAFDRPPSGWRSYFLAEGDRVELRGGELRFDLGGDLIEKGILVDGDGLTVTRLEASLDGGARPALLTGPGAPYAGGRIGPRALASARWPVPPAGPAVRVWRSPAAEEAVSRNEKMSAETEQRLRALGYLQ